MTGGGTAMALLWEPRGAPRRGPRPTLTLDAIAAAGIAIADADGLGAVTMQQVAERLGVTKMALYRYVPGKAELVALMIDLGLGEPPRLAGIDGGWRAQLGTWARRLFELFHAHPWALEATVGARVMGPNELGWLEQAVAALAGTGLRGAEAVDVAVTLLGHVRTIAQQVTAATRSPAPSMDDGLRSLLAGREERFPALSAALAAPGGTDQALDVGLRLILDGAALLIEGRGASPG